ncbi:MAG: phosphatidate cytidylyltransferase [Neisseriaceae bacterium]|nr:phosphatidate cytidylyltransferase [Neisseriaceae bacterium]MBP6862431.1 phosphatidate cytidylyltransferase [Neisseriaceae bacterium]
MTHVDANLRLLLQGLFALLVVASLIGFVLAKLYGQGSAKATIENLNARIRAWWLMCIVVTIALLVGTTGSVLLFVLISFFALRECLTLTPTKPSDHQTLFVCFFVILPLQYILVATGWYGLFSILIPVYVFLFVPTLIAMGGDTTDYMGRMAKIQWSLMIAIYCISHVPALLMLDIEGFSGENIKLILFLMIVVQGSDVLQYIFGKLWGKHPIAPNVSPNKTREGFFGGIGAAVLLGTSLWWITPFAPWQAALISLAITLAGFAGGLCMSAIKRDVGIKDFGAMIQGHGGMMDRIDSLCFSAPVFFHIIRFFFTD